MIKQFLVCCFFVVVVSVPRISADSGQDVQWKRTAGTPTPPAPAPIFTPTVPLTTTVLPPEECRELPSGSFLSIWQSDSILQETLGCPTSYHPRIIPQAWEIETSYQPFEKGMMLWANRQGWYAQPVIFVIPSEGRYSRFEDTFDLTTDTISEVETPPDGLQEPVMGFGKVWRDNPDIRDKLGWAVDSESPGTGYYQIFTGGNMVWAEPTGKTYVLISRAAVNLAWIFSTPFTN